MQNNKVEIDDVSLLSLLVFYLLPPSRKGEYTHIDTIMKIPGMLQTNVTKERVQNLLTKNFVALFRSKDFKGVEYCIPHAWFFTAKERGEPNFRTRSSDEIQIVEPHP